MGQPILLTMGDPAGIGPEIAAAFLAGRPDANACVVGDVGRMRHAAALRGCSLPVIDVEEVIGRPPGTIAVFPVSRLPRDLPFGVVDARAGAAAYAAIGAAIDLTLEGRGAAIVTGPIHKEALHAAGVPYPGHTEILAARTGTPEVAMMLADDHLRVLLVSIHVPLAEAVGLVTFERVLRAIRFAHEGARAFGFTAPRIAVAGLNPHAGEGGLFGREEIEAIVPAIEAARIEGLDASGPFSPDTVFMRARQGHFDIVVAQYHDQGLIPVKLLGLERGVNVTVGLPIIRTSVDHGTAFDVAGKGIADPASLARAYEVAEAMVAAKGI